MSTLFSNSPISTFELLVLSHFLQEWAITNFYLTHLITNIINYKTHITTYKNSYIRHKMYKK